MKAQTAHGRNGVVATGHALASEAALAVLQDGGNAVDAAVSAALVLSVACPYACTLGGDLYALVYEPKTGTISGLNGTGCSPLAATLERFLPGIPSNGPASATVPGLLRGLADLLARFGSRDLATLLRPAIRYAEEGFPVHRQLAANTAERAALLAKDPQASALFLPSGKPLVDGACFVQPDLARILRAVAEHGVERFYRGEIAARIAAASAKIGGLLVEEDFAAHASLWQVPIAAPFYGHEVVTMPPNSYGATLLFQLLDLEAGGIEAIDPNGPDFVLRGYEARRSAYRHAAALIADPRLVDGELRHLLAATIGKAGRPEPRRAAVPQEARDRCTTCATVIDRDGMAVSLIESISAPYGAGVVLEGTGIVLNNRLAGFNADPASPNCIAPAKRPANTLAPCLVMKDGRLVMSIGTPGTVGQTCTLAQFLARVLACGEEPAAAAAAPRWSVDFQGKLVLEDAMDESLRAQIGARSPDTRTMRTGWISFGSIKLAMVSDDGFSGVADQRRAATTLAW